MTRTVADELVETLSQAGVKRIQGSWVTALIQ